MNSTLNRVFSKLGDIIAPKITKTVNKGRVQVEHVKEPAGVASLSEQIEFLNDFTKFAEEEDIYEEDGQVAINHMIRLIEQTLRDAKKQDLDCVEVLLPADLMACVADDIISLAQDEPCGLRGGTVYLEYADRNVERSLGHFRLDQTAPSTFNIVVTLRPDHASWLKALSVKGYFSRLKNSVVVLSSSYGLSKNKLYRDDSIPEVGGAQ